MEEVRAPTAEAALRRILTTAVRERVSDVHIEPQESFIRVRFRRDGILYDRFTMMLAMKKPISVRAKVVGSMDIAESRLPQDGSYSETVDGVSYDFRISTLPSLYGETIVIRILSGKVDFIENNHLGMMDVQEKLFMKCLRRKSGMILTTGPTGSGKTSTLYAALRLLNDPSVNIISIEDPVEYRIEGVTQMQVNEKAGLTFEKGLRSIVRQDPDILMVGEIRDRETAEIAVHAALTGHLVLSTLHTVNAASAPLRLMDMGIAPYLLADSLSLIISQRIPGRLCPHCKRKVTLTEEKFADLSLPQEFLGETVMDAEGCEECHGSGIAGRIGAFEMIEIGREERWPKCRHIINKEGRLVIIEEKGLVKAIKDAYRYGGYTVLNQDGDVAIYTEGWFVRCLWPKLPRKALATIVEHMGMIPDAGEAVAIDKADQPQAVMDGIVRDDVETVIIGTSVT